jgi:hypothetical protein
MELLLVVFEIVIHTFPGIKSAFEFCSLVNISHFPRFGNDCRLKIRFVLLGGDIQFPNIDIAA